MASALSKSLGAFYLVHWPSQRVTGQKEKHSIAQSVNRLAKQSTDCSVSRSIDRWNDRPVGRGAWQGSRPVFLSVRSKTSLNNNTLSRGIHNPQTFFRQPKVKEYCIALFYPFLSLTKTTETIWIWSEFVMHFYQLMFNINTLRVFGGNTVPVLRVGNSVFLVLWHIMLRFINLVSIVFRTASVKALLLGSAPVSLALFRKEVLNPHFNCPTSMHSFKQQPPPPTPSRHFLRWWSSTVSYYIYSCHAFLQTTHAPLRGSKACCAFLPLSMSKLFLLQNIK